MVMILALCTTSDGPISMYQVSFNFLVYFQRYAQDKLFIGKIKRSNFINTVDSVTILALCISADGSLSVIKFHLIPLYTFRDMLLKGT